MEEREYAYWLSRIDGLGNALKRRIRALYGSAERAFKAGKWPVPEGKAEAVEEGRRRLPEILREWEDLPKRGLSWCGEGEAAFPARLRILADAPLGLYYRGKLPREDLPAVGIVGARDCSDYGAGMAAEFGGNLAAHGVQIVSGMAAGIDGAAQKGALDAGGESFAVLGSGAEICYPPRHRRLYESLCARGGVISEFPPETPPLAHHFPQRNRLIAALSDQLLVMEAREKSGSLITVDQALEMGRDIWALPGRVGDERSRGCLRLIRQGAAVLIEAEDVLESLGLGGGREQPAAQPGEGGLSLLSDPRQRALWKRMGREACHVEDLLEEGLGMGELTLLLWEMETAGAVAQISPGRYRRL